MLSSPVQRAHGSPSSLGSPALDASFDDSLLGGPISTPRQELLRRRWQEMQGSASFMPGGTGPAASAAMRAELASRLGVTEATVAALERSGDAAFNADKLQFLSAVHKLASPSESPRASMSASLSRENLAKAVGSLTFGMPAEELAAIIQEAPVSDEGAVSIEAFLHCVKARCHVNAVAEALHVRSPAHRETLKGGTLDRGSLSRRPQTVGSKKRSLKTKSRRSSGGPFKPASPSNLFSPTRSKGLPSPSKSTSRPQLKSLTMKQSPKGSGSASAVSLYSRPTPRCLTTGSSNDLNELRRQLEATHESMLSIEENVKRDVVQIIRRVPHASPAHEKTRDVCRKWALDKLEKVSHTIRECALANAMARWRNNILREDHQRLAIAFFKTKASMKLGSILYSWALAAFRHSWRRWVTEVRRQQLAEQTLAVLDMQRVTRGHLTRTKLQHQRQSRAAIQIQKIEKGRQARRKAAAERAKAAEERAKAERAAEKARKKAEKEEARLRAEREKHMTKEEIEESMQDTILDKHAELMAAEAVTQAELDKKREAERLRRAEETAAAIEVQRAARGALARREVARLKYEHEQREKEIAAKIKAEDIARRKRMEFEASKTEQQAREEAAIRIQRIARGRAGRRKVAAARAEHQAAMSVQKVARGRLARKRVSKMKEEHAAATRIQAVSRGKKARGEVAAKRAHAEFIKDADTDAAAITLQRTARGRAARRRVAKLREDKAAGRDPEESAALSGSPADAGHSSGP